MEAHAVCEDLSSENHQALCQVIFRSGFFFKALYRFKTITSSFSLTSQCQRDVQIKRNINVHSYCRHRTFIVKLEHESLCPSLYLTSKL